MTVNINKFRNDFRNHVNFQHFITEINRSPYLVAFMRLSVLIFALMLLPLCACITENSDSVVIIDAVDDRVADGNSPLGISGVIIPVPEEEQKQCLSFSKGRDINRVEELIAFYKLENYVTYKNVQTGEYGYVDIFSARYDLNDDGKDEYFYYFESMRYCGMQLGCPINLYEYNDGKFNELFKHGIITNNYFDPYTENSDYICIDKEKDFGWKRIYKKMLPSIFYYNGTEYTGRIF